MNGRERVRALLRGDPVDRLPLMPITMMYAADLIGVPYGDYATDHRVLARAQTEVAALHGFDHVSAISDPAREAADLGAGIAWFADQPPTVDGARALLADKRVLARLTVPDPLRGGRMTDRVRAIGLLDTMNGSDLLVEGWVEGPCATGANLRGINVLMLDLVDDPGFVDDLFGFAVEVALSFARAQVEAGADLIGIGDAAASLIGPDRYRSLVLPHEQRLVEGIHALGALARLHICGRTTRLLPWLGSVGADIVDLDSMVSLAAARAAMGEDQVLLGNVDPVAVLRNGAPAAVTLAFEQCHREAGRRYVVGAGCEIVRDSPAANVEAMAQYAATHRPGGQPSRS